MKRTSYTQGITRGVMGLAARDPDGITSADVMAAYNVRRNAANQLLSRMRRNGILAHGANQGRCGGVYVLTVKGRTLHALGRTK